MNKWIKNRIKELTEKRREELTEYFEEHEWAGGFGESEEEKLSLHYSEQYIPPQIEKLMFEDGWDEEFIKALQDINFKYCMPSLKESWDEIEKKYPEYFEDIKNFFEPYIQEYNKGFQENHDSALEEYVTHNLEQEADDIRDRAMREYEEMTEGSDAD